ncbi:MAG: response regulator [Verrucomicrobiota bacterium]|nr:response regulator [Verrucomicrobiota bacterium]
MSQTTAVSTLSILLLHGKNSLLIPRVLDEQLADKFSLTVVQDLKQAIEVTGTGGFDIVLLDIFPKDEIGLSTFTRFHTQFPKVAVVLIVDSESENLGTQGVYEGAQDYWVNSKDDTGHLLRCIRYAIDRNQIENTLNQKEEQIQYLQRLETIESLATGVAHNFNNIMTIVTGYSDLLLKRLEPEDPSCKLVEEIQKAANRANQLMQHLLAYTNRGTTGEAILNLNNVLTDMDKLLRPLIGGNIDLLAVLSPTPGLVEIDKSALEQVIINLIIHSRDSMPMGGKVTIETSSVDFDEVNARQIRGLNPGSYVMLAVSDTGPGLDAEPGFTQGYELPEMPGFGDNISLGLATVHGIVKQHKGHVLAFSERGQGNTFKVYFPKVNQTGKIEPHVEAVTELVSGIETVLVVDDEESVRDIIVDVLENCGYKVLQACDGEQAIQVAGQHEGKINIVVTDLVMPRMGGRELAESLRPFHPDLKVLYMSGYSGNAAFTPGSIEREIAFLAKPFTISGLSVKVREVLDGPPQYTLS